MSNDHGISKCNLQERRKKEEKEEKRERESKGEKTKEKKKIANSFALESAVTWVHYSCLIAYHRWLRLWSSVATLEVL
jgi:hypothetical protein